jgi:uncharacterized delta-60 repeat protein
MKLALSRGRPVLCLALAGALVFAIGSAQATPGALDPSFGTGGEVTTTVGSGTTYTEAEALRVQPDGKIVAAGYGTNGSNYDFALARYNPSGSLDTSFDGDGKVVTDFGSHDDLAYSLALQPDGKIVVAGRSHNGGDWDFALARYNPDGSLDTSFGPAHNGKVRTDFASSNDLAYGVALQPDGKIVVAGGSYTTFPNYLFAVARYNPDGSLDTTFNGTGKVTTSVGGVDDQANAVALQPDGKIVTGGNSWNGSNDDFALVRYNANGSLDTSFNATGKLTTAVGSGFDVANALALQPDGKIVAAGSSVNTGAYSVFGLVRYNPNGSLDTSFGSGGKVWTEFTPYGDGASALALQPDGKIVAAGTSSGRNFALARYNPNGSLDTSFDGDGKVLTSYNGNINTFLSGYSVALQPDGKIVIAGSGFNDLDSSWKFVLARYLGSTLTVSKAGSGAGTVTSSPSGINCGSTCSAPFAALPVTLTATAASGSSFSGWTGDCSGTGTCELSMSADHVVTATFQSDKTLTVTKAGSGAGTVTSNPGGIDCGSACSHAYRHGTSVTLTVAAASGSTFTGWSGDCSGTGTCTLTMSAGHSVTATFKPLVKCHVPKVKGKTLKQAKKKIRAAHCRVGKVTKAYSKKVKKGRVISQKPKPGVTKPAGAKVAIKVSKGKKK